MDYNDYEIEFCGVHDDGRLAAEGRALSTTARRSTRIYNKGADIAATDPVQQVCNDAVLTPPTRRAWTRSVSGITSSTTPPHPSGPRLTASTWPPKPVT